MTYRPNRASGARPADGGGKSSQGTWVVLIAPVDRIEARPRLVKFARIYAKRFPVQHWGWRNESLETGISRRFLVKGGQRGRWTRHVRYPVWSCAVLVRALGAPSGAILHCLGLETALPAAFARSIRSRLGRRTFVIFDDADRTSQSLPSRFSFLAPLVARMERFTYGLVDLHIAPTRYRYLDLDPDRRARIQILENTPDVETFEEARKVELPALPPAEVYVYVNGRLAADRGAGMILDAAKKLVDADWCRFVVAGAGYDGPAESLRSLPNVTDLGRLPLVQSLALYRLATIVPTFYDPSSRIVNRYALSNKWGDCVAFKTPFVTNSGIVTAEPYLRRGIGHVIEYGDSDALVALIRRLRPPFRPPSRNNVEPQRRGSSDDNDWMPFDLAATRVVVDNLPAWATGDSSDHPLIIDTSES